MSLGIFVLTSSFVSIFTWQLSKHPKWGNIRASAFISILGFIVFSLINIYFPVDVNKYSAIVFGASFVGMSCPTRFSKVDMALSGATFSLIFSFIGNYLQGMGGVLGLSAFLSVIAIHIIRQIHLLISPKMN